MYASPSVHTEATGSDLSWALLRAAPVTAENAGFWFVSHCQELELYFLRITHTQL